MALVKTRLGWEVLVFMVIMVVMVVMTLIIILVMVAKVMVVMVIMVVMVVVLDMVAVVDMVVMVFMAFNVVIETGQTGLVCKLDLALCYILIAGRMQPLCSRFYCHGMHQKDKQGSEKM